MKTYLLVSGTIFGIVALLHLLRLAFGWPAEIAGWSVPGWVSWAALAAAALLAGWAFRLLARAAPERRRS